MPQIKKLSLTRLIENNLNSLTAENSSGNEIEISPYVKSLSSKVNIPIDYDYKKEYANYLDNKHIG